MRLFPKQVDFFEIFDKAALNVTGAAGLLVELMENFNDVEGLAKRIYDAEHEGDMLTHDIIKKLNKTFITPIDREDLYTLASRLDDILDLIWSATDRISIFNIKYITKEAISLSKDLMQTTEVIHKTIRKLKEKNYSHVQELCIEINRLENRIDRIFRNALGGLFVEMNDPLEIIKWKEIYELLEDASDRCEDVANVIESIVLKHA
jgi:predicted phosphate transport protein (TIGR00153 family)